MIQEPVLGWEGGSGTKKEHVDLLLLALLALLLALTRPAKFRLVCTHSKGFLIFCGFYCTVIAPGE